MTLINKVLISI